MAHTTPIGQVHITTRLVPIALLIGLLSLLSLNAASQRVITTLTDGNSTFTYFSSSVDLNLVIYNASDNDTIILPGGPIQVNGNIQITKPITLIGAGYLDQASQVVLPTTIVPSGNYVFYVDNDVQDVHVHGLRIQRDIIHQLGSNNISYTRCDIEELFMVNSGNYPAAEDITIRECIFHNPITNGASTGVSGLTIQNSVLDGGLNMGEGISSSSSVEQCTILGPGLDGNVNEGVTYRHCVITEGSGSMTIVEQACFEDCLLVLGNDDQVTPNQCYTGYGNVAVPAQFSNPFVNVPWSNLEAFDASYDYHILSGSVGYTMGQANTQVGIHGGYPGTEFKALGIPFNPNWLDLDLPPLTQGGSLTPVTISGAAQSY